MNRILPITIAAFLIVLTGCRKEEVALNSTKGGKVQPGNAYYTSTSQLTENQINQSMRATAKGLAQLIYQRQDLIDLTRDMIAAEFDGDYNVLIQHLADESNSQLSLNLYNSIPALTDETITGSFLHSFHYVNDENTQLTLRPQIYSPDAEYWTSIGDKDHDNESPIVVWCPYFDLMQEDEDDYFEGFQWNGSDWDIIMVNEEMLFENSVWVVSINERYTLADLQTPPSTRTERPLPDGCTPEWAYIELVSTTTTEYKERWVEGASEIAACAVWLEPGAFEIDKSLRSMSDPLLGTSNHQIFVDPIKRRAVREGNPVLYSVPTNRFYIDWLLNCTDNQDRGVRVMIYEYDWHGKLKAVVPKDAMVYDYQDDDNDIKIDGNLYDYVDGIDSKDFDFDPNDANKFQFEFLYRTARRTNKDNRGMTIPFLQFDILTTSVATGPNTRTFSSSTWSQNNWFGNPNYPSLNYCERWDGSTRPSSVSNIYHNVHSGMSAQIYIGLY